LEDTSAAVDGVSFSYARDFFWPDADAAYTGEIASMARPMKRLRAMEDADDSDAAADAVGKEEEEECGTPATGGAMESEMTNVEGTYAVQQASPEDVVLEEEAHVAIVHHGRCSVSGFVACAVCLRCPLEGHDMVRLVQQPEARKAVLAELSAVAAARRRNEEVCAMSSTLHVLSEACSAASSWNLGPPEMCSVSASPARP
jgi:hypothetical protein